ncbi:hypothetical protein Tco_0817262, partial [Tanacetum coccineum]
PIYNEQEKVLGLRRVLELHSWPLITNKPLIVHFEPLIYSTSHQPMGELRIARVSRYDAKLATYASRRSRKSLAW